MTRVLLDTSGYSALLRGHQEVKAFLQRVDEIYVNPVVLLGRAASRLLAGNPAETRMSSAGTPIPTNDIWIAASAMQHGLRVVTTDARFQGVRQALVSCFEAAR